MGLYWVNVFFAFVYVVLFVPVSCEEFERHPNDGWFNNLLHPDWGAIDTHLLRRSPASYSDGVYEPSGSRRPNPLDISKIAFSGKDGLSSKNYRNALMVFFGQQLVEEIMDAQRPGCPMEYFNIKVPKTHEYNPEHKHDLEMPFLRSRYDQRTGHSPNNPRQQLNEITPYLDGNLVYGAGKALEDALREFKGGRLLTADPGQDLKDSYPAFNDIRLPFANPPSPRDHVLKPVSRFHRFGNPRTHENPFLFSLAVIWFRYHNYLAEQIKRKNNHFSDEEIFNLARKKLIAVYQNIVMYEWLPAWLRVDSKGRLFSMEDYPYHGGSKSKYEGYDPQVHPGITTEFQAAAMRFGHTLVPSGVKTIRVLANTCMNSTRKVRAQFTTRENSSFDQLVDVYGVRLCNSYWIPEPDPSLDEVVRGMVFTLAAREDNIIVSDLKDNVFGPLEWSRRDLGALNIQRGRELGLPGYNAVRQAYGLQPKSKWELISNDADRRVISELKSLYGNTTAPDDLDLFPGGLLETNPEGPGELFREITLDQFLRIRHGDRFWFENTANGLFTSDEIKEIRNTNFYDVVSSVTNAFTSEETTGTRRNIFLCMNVDTIPGCPCITFDPDFISSDPNMARETCVPLKHYDYFQGSEAAYVLTIIVIVLSIPVTVGIMKLIAKRRKTSLDQVKSGPHITREEGPSHFYATEWVGRNSLGINSREVKIQLDERRHKLLVANLRGQVVRMIDLRRRAHHEQKPKVSVARSSDKGYKLMILAAPAEIDLVLHFQTQHERELAFDKLRNFISKTDGILSEAPSSAEHILWREAVTIDQRKKILTKFFKSILAAIPSGESSMRDYSEGHIDEEVLETKLTRSEFADVLGLQPQSLFVRNMYLLMDTSGDGLISFDEFKTYFGILCTGTAEQKAEMFFKMFDTSRSGKLTKENYKKMIKSLVELNDTEDQSRVNIDSMVDIVFRQQGKDSVNGVLSFEDFKSVMFSGHSDILNTAVLNLEFAGETMSVPPRYSRGVSVKERAMSVRKNYTAKARPSSMVNLASLDIQIEAKRQEVPKTRLGIMWQNFCRNVENKKRQIFWVTLYTLLTLGIFIEQAYHYSFEREHGGLRRIAGYGVSVTRGAASAQMFTFASLFVTMSRNTLTVFRETFLHQYIPFDSAHDMHIYVAGLAMFFTVMHVLGHLINLYHISTQPSLDLNCYFREYFRATHELASFQYWTYQTITGLTGVALVLILVVMYVFASSFARRHVFFYFSNTHRLYILVYILMFLHGAARLVQVPFWPYFFLGPMVLFVVDKLVSLSRNKILLPVHKVTMLPSGVINLVFKRPLTFNYQSGQWVRIACPALGSSEYHPFTLTSSPHEDRLSLHIRAVGPWTNNLIRIYDPSVVDKANYPKIYVDGPFGESHQDWYRYPVSVLVGGGIGVTPFASILKDIAFKSAHMNRLPCQKVYFIWVTRTQKSFEWMTDIIRQVETADIKNFVEVHICITEIKKKYDLRTTMLYVCERHFQKIAGLSMFTGLKSKTHFGRPKFADFFESLKIAHAHVDQIGVFSCGPPPMTRSVQQGCSEANNYLGPSLIHHYENF